MSVTYKKHIVVRGETLSGIAKRYGTTASEIKKYNPIIKDINLIQTGWTLTIPIVSKGSETTSKPSEPVSKPSEPDYEKIGKAFQKCMKDIEALDSFKELSKLV